MRNVLPHAGKQGRRVVSAFIGTAFAQDDAEAARIQWRQVADQPRPRVKKLAEVMDDAESDVLAYMAFPAAHRPKLHSTDPIERLNSEIKRRTDVVGMFPMKSHYPPRRTQNHPAVVPARRSGVGKMWVADAVEIDGGKPRRARLKVIAGFRKHELHAFVLGAVHAR